MQQIQRRILSVVERKATNLVVDRVLVDETDQLQQARRQEREAKAKALARAAADQQSVAPSESTSPSAIQELIEEEDCPVCTSILEAIARMDDPKRTRGVAEYGQFRAAIEESEDAAEEALEDSDVLIDALNDVQGVGGL